MEETNLVNEMIAKWRASGKRNTPTNRAEVLAELVRRMPGVAWQVTPHREEMDGIEIVVIRNEGRKA